jgi:hypothetical protein
MITNRLVNALARVFIPIRLTLADVHAALAMFHEHVTCLSIFNQSLPREIELLTRGKVAHRPGIGLDCEGKGKGGEGCTIKRWYHN